MDEETLRILKLIAEKERRTIKAVAIAAIAAYAALPKNGKKS